MKRLIDDFEVTARGYYYLLDWNQTNNWKFISLKFNKTKLSDLTLSEYKILFEYATSSEFHIEGFKEEDIDQTVDLIHTKIGLDPGYVFFGDDSEIEKFNKFWKMNQYENALYMLAIAPDINTCDYKTVEIFITD